MKQLSSLGFCFGLLMVLTTITAWASGFKSGDRITCQGVTGTVVTENVNGDSLKVGITSDDGRFFVFNKSKCN